jgi:hypothetical protein
MAHFVSLGLSDTYSPPPAPNDGTIDDTRGETPPSRPPSYWLATTHNDSTALN